MRSLSVFHLIFFGLAFSLLTGCGSTSPIRQDLSAKNSGSSARACLDHYTEMEDGIAFQEYVSARAMSELSNRSIAAASNAAENKTPAPSDAGEFLEHISVLDAEGHGAEVVKKLRGYLAQNPEDKRAVFLLAVHFWRNHNREMATFIFGQLEKDSTFPWKSLLVNNLGMIALSDKNRELALSYFEKATNESPASPAPFVNLGAMYLQSRSYTAAQPLFEKARHMDPDFEDATLGFAVALEGQGKFEEAHSAYAEFINSHPNSLTVVYNDSLILGNRLARKEEAAQQMLRYVQRGGKEAARAQEIIQSWR